MPMGFMDFLCRCFLPGSLFSDRVNQIIADQGLIYVPRHLDGNGDPAAYDFDETVLTTDGTWRELDLTGIVPANAETVVLHVHVQDNLANQILQFRRAGNVNAILTADTETRIANQVAHNTYPVAARNGMVEYNAENTTWTSIEIVVVGWFIAPG